MLSILIPTYNRAEFLKKNLNILSRMITGANLQDLIEIIISDNHSTDETSLIIPEFISQSSLKIRYSRQEQNVGLKKNALYVLSESKEEYIMFLGDDDFISQEYLVQCFSLLKKNKSTAAIVPNYVPVSVNDEVMGDPRDKFEGTMFYSPGFNSVLKNAYKGHQMSGLVFKREGLINAYQDQGADNIYLFIFFLCISALKGDVYQITDLPVRVVQPIQKKDWSYGEDGLINEVFDNFKSLPISYFKRFLLERHFMQRNLVRLRMYQSKGLKVLTKAFFKISFAKNATILFSLYFPFYLAQIKAIGTTKKLVNRIGFK